MFKGNVERKIRSTVAVILILIITVIAFCDAVHGAANQWEGHDEYTSSTADLAWKPGYIYVHLKKSNENDPYASIRLDTAMENGSTGTSTQILTNNRRILDGEKSVGTTVSYKDSGDYLVMSIHDPSAAAGHIREYIKSGDTTWRNINSNMKKTFSGSELEWNPYRRFGMYLTIPRGYYLSNLTNGKPSTTTFGINLYTSNSTLNSPTKFIESLQTGPYSDDHEVNVIMATSTLATGNRTTKGGYLRFHASLNLEFSPNKTNVYYLGNGGVTSDNRELQLVPVTYDTAAQIMSNIFTREGYSFTGWQQVHDDPDSNSWVPSDKSYSPGQNVTTEWPAESSVYLQAQWAEINFGDQTRQITYDPDNPQNVVITAATGGAGGAFSYSKASGSFSVSGGNIVVPAGTAAGTYTTYVRATEAGGGTKDAKYTITVKKADMTVTPTAYSGTYDGSAHYAKIKVNVAGARVAYGTSTSYGQTLSAESANTDYDMSGVSRTQSGTTTVYYKVTKANYNDVTGSTSINIGVDPTVTVTFKSGINGATTKTSSYVPGSSLIVPSGNADLSAYGWTLAGWRTDTSANTPTYTGTSFSYSESATTLYAVYTRNLKINYKAAGGSGGAPSATNKTQYYNSGGAASNVSTPSFTLASNTFTAPAGSYSFSKWDIGNAGASYTGFKPNADSSTTTKDATAQWTRTLHFYSGFGKGTDNSVTQTYGTNVSTPSPTIMYPWTFEGWRSDAAAGTASYTGSTYAYTNTPVNLYAVYSRELTLSYTNGGGSGTAPTSSKATQRYNTQGNRSTPGFTLASNTFTAPSGGYSFSKWAAGSAGASYTGWNPEANSTTVTNSTAAVWTRTVTFNSGINSATHPTATQTYGSNVTVPSAAADISSYGWSFLGWRTDTTASTEAYTGSSFSPSSQTVYAVYSRTLTLSYTAGGGTGTPPSNSTATQYYNSGGDKNNVSTASITLRANTFTKAGYTFSQWDVGSSPYSWKPDAISSASKSTAAQWSSYTVTVKFNANGGSTSSGSYKVTSAGAVTDTSNAEITQSVGNDDAFFDLKDISEFGLTRTGYHTDASSAWKNASGDNSPSGTYYYHQNDSAANTTNKVTAKRLNGGSDLTSNVTKTIYANWQINVLTINYYANTGSASYQNNGGAATTTQLLGTETTYFNGTDYSSNGISNANVSGGRWYLTRSAYTATNKWHVGSEASSTIINADTPYATNQLLAAAAGQNLAAGNVTLDLYLDWTDKTATLTYNANGHGTAPAPVTMNYADPTTAAAALTVQGWQFLNWNTKQNGSGSSYTAGSGIVKPAGTDPQDMTLYAQWKAKDYTIQFDMNDSTSAPATLSTPTLTSDKRATGTYDSVLTIANPTRESNEAEMYVFTGWSISGMDTTCTHYWDNSSASEGHGTGSSASNVTATRFKNLHSTEGVVTFKANWKRAYRVEISGTLDGAASPNISGYGTADVYINGVALATGVTDYNAIHPQGTAIQVDVHPASGKAFDPDTSTNISVASMGAAPVAINIVLGTSYNIAYAGLENGSFGTHHPESAIGGVTFTVDNPTRPGYDFRGWKITSMDSSQHTYGTDTTTATSIANTKATTFRSLRTSAGTVTFTAQWDLITYNITYDMNDASGSTRAVHTGTKPATYTVETNTFTVSKPTRTGYTFKGWTIDIAPTAWGAGSVTTGKDITVAKGTYGNIKLKATWAPISCNVTFEPQGGTFAGRTSATTLVMTFDSEDNRSPGAAQLTDYVFNGWFTETRHGTQVFDPDGVFATGDYWYSPGKWQYPHDLTVYAQWEEPLNFRTMFAVGEVDETPGSGSTSQGSSDHGTLANIKGEGYQYELYEGSVPDGTAGEEKALRSGYKYYTRSLAFDSAGNIKGYQFIGLLGNAQYNTNDQ